MVFPITAPAFLPHGEESPDIAAKISDKRGALSKEGACQQA